MDRSFFEAMWPGLPPGAGDLTLWRSPSKLSDHVPLEALRSWDAEDQAILDGYSRAGENLYFGLSLRRRGLSARQQGAKTDLLWLPSFALDIDVAAPGAHAAANLPPTFDAAATLLDGAPAPSAIVFTGFGLHVYWFFHQPISIQSAGIGALESRYAQFQAWFIAVAALRGWHLDSTATLQRVWRVPGFPNWKRKDRPPVVQTVLLDRARRYALEDLVAAPPPGAAPAAPGTRSTVSPHGEVASGAAAPALPDHPVLSRLAKRLWNLVDESRREIMRRVVLGQSFADPGSRDHAMTRAAGVVGWLEPDESPDLLVEIFRPSLSVWAAEPGAKLTLDQELAKARKKIRSGQRKWHEREGIYRDALARVALRMQSANGAAPSESTEVAALPPPDEPPADEDLVRVSIVQHRSGYFVFDFAEQKYRPMATKEELPTVIRDAWAQSPSAISWFYTNAKGEQAKKTLPMILHDYSVVAEKLVSDISIQTSYYDPRTRTMYEAVCPMRDFDAVFDPQIDRWLQLLGGPAASKLLDWIATVCRIDSQNSALYLAGVSGAGKSLLAAGLAQLWHEGEPTELGHVVGSFNGDIARCPLLYADEGLPKGEGISKLLRSLIGNDSRTLSRKYLPNSTLRGAIRLIIASNNDTALQMGDEDMTLLDLEAVAGRFLHIFASREAAGYLADLKAQDPDVLKTWVKGGGIARHALWLAEHRRIVLGRRFLVEGEETEMHRKLLLQGTANGLIFEWIVRFIESPGKLTQYYLSKRQPLRARVGSGKILVNVQAVVDCWQLYMPDHTIPPTTNRIGRILRAVSKGEERFPYRNGPRYHSLSTELVTAWAVENQMGDEETIQATYSQVMYDETDPTSGPPPGIVRH